MENQIQNQPQTQVPETFVSLSVSNSRIKGESSLLLKYDNMPLPLALQIVHLFEHTTKYLSYKTSLVYNISPLSV